MENRKKALEDEYQTFDKKPVIVQPWSPTLDIRKTDIDIAPIWVKS